MNKEALCLIVNKPNKNYLDFLDNFVNYEIYVIIDDNTFDYSTQYKNDYKNINLIQITDIYCKISGFINTNKIGVRKLISGWDKALLYFSVINKKHGFVWFIEDDVFFYNEESILNLDKKYKYYDILCNCDFIEGIYDTWLWKYIKIHLPKPHYKGMMCATRISRKLLDCINKYAKKNKQLFFLEALFPTITKYNNLTYYHPDELKTVLYRRDWNDREIDKINIYHPIKDQSKHVYFRTELNASNN
jgi:hypothetical protein